MWVYPIALVVFIVGWRWAPRPPEWLRVLVGGGFLVLSGLYLASAVNSGHPLVGGPGLPVILVGGLIGLGGLLYLLAATATSTPWGRRLEVGGLVALLVVFLIPGSLIVFLTLVALLAGASIGPGTRRPITADR